MAGLTPPPNALCGHCGTPSPAHKTCERCRAVRFCSVECQHAAWPAHKEACAVTARSLAAMEARGAGRATGPTKSDALGVNAWVTEDKARYLALQCLAWRLQHARQAWGDPPLACSLNVIRGASDTATLRVGLYLLAVPDATEDAAMASHRALLARVNVDEGYVASIPDRKLGTATALRMRYSMPAAALEQLAQQAGEHGWVRITARQGSRAEAEIAITPFRSLLGDAGAAPADAPAPAPAAVARAAAQAGAGASMRCAAPACTAVRASGGGELKACSRCGRARYCSRECQVAHWKAHKPDCKPAASAAA